MEYNNKLKMQLLQAYATDMTLLAEKGKLDPVIGREKETNELIQVLLKKKKRNACLVGDAGVGKTAIVEGLAIKIAQRSVPCALIGKKVFSTDMGRLLAGTTLRGMLEERVKRLLEEVQASAGMVILFIDELHSIIKTSYKGNDTANIMKPALARGDFMCIGATTMEEYTKYIERDAALKRRFESIHVCEPSRDESINILEALIHRYEFHHCIHYSPMAIHSAVDLSIRYLRDLFLPDKAIDLIDKAGSRAQLLGKIYVTEDEIQQLVSERTGIPLTKVSSKESQRLLQLEETLKRSLIGQDEAVAAVCRSIRRARAGIRDETKPVGCFLFTGPTGVGKTEMAKVLAGEYYVGSKESMVRLDMSEYMDYHSVSRLIGCPPGHPDNHEGGRLTEAVRRNPHILILFDEVDKAHQKVLDLLLQILDDGRLSDGKGVTVDFSNTIVILTSNSVTNSISKNDASDQLRGLFKPELLNRFDQVVVFTPLDKGHIKKILEITIDKFRTRVAATKKIEFINFSETLMELLISEGYDERYGGRALKRAFTTLVEDKLAEVILEADGSRHSVLMDVASSGEVVCQIVSQQQDSNSITTLQQDSSTTLQQSKSSSMINRHGSVYRPIDSDPKGLRQLLIL